jgi:prolyl 4-hydroxylase
MYLGSDGQDHLFPQWNDLREQHKMLDQFNSVQLTSYKNSYAAPTKQVAVLRGEDSEDLGERLPISWSIMKNLLHTELALLHEGSKQQPWGLYTASGERIIGELDEVADGDGVNSNKHIMSSIVASGMVVVAQGGNWLWPGVHEGYERIIELAPPSDAASSGPRNITIETLSLTPLVLSIKGFLSEEECDYIAKKAEPTLQYSGVSLKDFDVGKAASNWRTSQSTFLAAQGDPILMEIEHRTASLTRVPRNHQEYVQVLRYGHTEKYDAHHDYFDPEHYKSDPNTLRLIEHGKKNRFATVFWYLTDVEDGGHTIFPRAGGRRELSYTDCSSGLKVKPQKGKVIIFYSLDASGAMDPSSLHGACPVGEGNVKWAANKWIWNAPMGYVI